MIAQSVGDDVATPLVLQVRLTSAAKMQTASYSGGMRRRLSVAVALLGDPRVVILDEPTTGGWKRSKDQEMIAAARSVSVSSHVCWRASSLGAFVPQHLYRLCCWGVVGPWVIGLLQRLLKATVTRLSWCDISKKNGIWIVTG